MPVTWEIRQSVVILNLHGHYTCIDVTRALVAAAIDPRFTKGSAVLVDATSSLTQLSHDELQARIEVFVALERLEYGGRIAAVVDQPHHGRDVAHFIESLGARGREAQIFADRASAERWLGLV